MVPRALTRVLTRAGAGRNRRGAVNRQEAVYKPRRAEHARYGVEILYNYTLNACYHIRDFRQAYAPYARRIDTRPGISRSIALPPSFQKDTRNYYKYKKRDLLITC